MAERIDEDVKQRSPASARHEPWGSACGVKSMRKVHITGFSRFPHRQSYWHKEAPAKPQAMKRTHRREVTEGAREKDGRKPFRSGVDVRIVCDGAS
jgi:hypothetical protein